MSGGALLGIPAIGASTDNALARWDGATGQYVQDSDQTTLTDGEVLVLAPTAAQAVIGGTTTTVLFNTITLTPHLVLYQSGSTDPTVAMLRDSTAATGAPGHNFFRSRGGGLVAASDLVMLFSGSGHDGTDYANLGALEFSVDSDKYDGSAMTGPGNNNMPGKCRLTLSPDGSQAPTGVITFKNDKEIRLAATAFLTIPNTGLKLADTNASHHLTIKPGTDLTGHHTLTITTPDADVTLNIADGSVTISAAAATVLDDATVAAMVDTLGGAASTGTGGLARATSPTFVTPALGTPASGTLTNCTGLPLAGLDSAAYSMVPAASKLVEFDASQRLPQGVSLFFSNGCAQNTTTTLRYGNVAGTYYVVPAGWKLAITAISMHASTVGGAAQTSTGALWVGSSVAGIADQSGSFGTLQVSSGTDVGDECEPTSPPFVIDATSARQFVNIKITNSATTGTVTPGVTVMGILWKP